MWSSQQDSLCQSVAFMSRLSHCHGALYCSQSLLVAFGTHLSLPQHCCCPWHWICYLLLIPSKSDRASVTHTLLPKVPQDVQSCMSDRGSERCICHRTCVTLATEASPPPPAEPEVEVGGLPAASQPWSSPLQSQDAVLVSITHVPCLEPCFMLIWVLP